MKKTYQIGSCCKDTLWRAYWNLVWATGDAVRSDIPSNATNIRKLRVEELYDLYIYLLLYDLYIYDLYYSMTSIYTL